jgi:hypothetical protein
MLLWLFRLTIVVLAIFSFCYFFRVFHTGKKLRQRGIGAGQRLTNHKRVVLRVFQVTLITVLVVEFFALFLPQIHRHVWIYPIHLWGFAVPFSLLFLLLWSWANGEDYPKLHRILVLPCLFFGMIASVLGVYMAFLVPRH